VLVKFDKEYAYGDTEDEFKKVAAAATSQPELIVAEVPIQGFCKYSVFIHTYACIVIHIVIVLSKNTFEHFLFHWQFIVAYLKINSTEYFVGVLKLFFHLHAVCSGA